MGEINQYIQGDKGWTLFLDRDGVINVENKGSYITNWADFNFCDGALDALGQLGELFDNIVVVTNQRGVGRGIMSLDSLNDIHLNMVETVVENGGAISKVYACTAINDDDHNRKPNTGMAQQAKEDFPEIDFSKAIMVGNNLSDMQFGKKMGMYTVFLTTTQPAITLPHDLIDEQYPSLQSWVSCLAAATV